MKPFWTPWLLACTLLFAGPAQAESPFLWRIEGRTPAYLFGTIHSANPELNRLPDSVTDAFGQATHFYGELRLDPQTLARTAALFQLPSGQTLRGQLPPPLAARADALLRRLNPALSLDSLATEKTWALIATLAVIEDQLRFPGRPMMDQRLYQQALAAGKETGGLETPEEQAGVFERLDAQELQQLLGATLDYMERALDEDGSVLDDTYAAYRSGDPERFRELMEQQMDLPLLLEFKLDRLLLTQRNERMARRIARLVQTHPERAYFFAVGAAHFSGGQALQYQLRRLGLQITRVR